MEENIENQARLFNYTTELFKGHEKLLADTNRNRVFYNALKKRVTGDKSVLDIGSGTGVWAIVAARLGAKMVVAVERDPLLIGVIRSLARANGVSDRVEAVAGDSRQLGFGRKFDIIISETVGNLAFEEQIVPIMMDARQRLLNPGGVLIPESVALVAAPARLKKTEKKMPSGIELEYDLFESLCMNIPAGLPARSSLKLMAEPKNLTQVDLREVTALPDFIDMTAEWEIEDPSQINCFAIWAEATLAKNIKLTGLRTTSWTPLLYRIVPFKGERGLLEFKLTLTATTNYWSATFTGEQEQHRQSYSPAYAAALLLAQSKTATDLLGSPHRMSFIGLSADLNK